MSDSAEQQLQHLSPSPTEDTPPSKPDDGLMNATRILALGNIVSKVMGLLRQMLIANIFGASLTSVYQSAVLVPMTLFEMIRGGMVESALVPTFNELAEEENRDVLWSAISAFLSTAVIALIGLVIVAELLYRPIGFITGVTDFDDPALTDQTLQLMRIAFPAVIFLSTASIFTALLYALKRFTIPAFLPAVFNTTLVVTALLWRDVTVLIYGMLAGALLQVAIQLPFLRDMKLRWNFDWRHPAVRKIVKLFAPVFAVLVINFAVMTSSYKVANLTPAGDGAFSYMVSATTLTQFPYGLIVTAISAAILPTLSEKKREGDEPFKQTLGQGLRLVMSLIVPAAIGLIALAHPIVDLVFGHGEFDTAYNIDTTARALQLYAIGLPFAGIDLILIYAAYARNDTRRPAIIGVISLIVYTVFMLGLFRPLGFFCLMVADIVKHITHTILMLIIIQQEVGTLRGLGIASLAVKVLSAAAVMGISAWFVARLLNGMVAGNIGELFTVGTAGFTGILIYAAFVFLFNLTEVKQLILHR